jgi:hypothetical protein
VPPQQQPTGKIGGGAGTAPPRRVQIFTPVTIKMIKDAGEIDPATDAVILQGHPVSDVIVIGRLICKSEETLRIVFEVNDNTECCRVVFY